MLPYDNSLLFLTCLICTLLYSSSWSLCTTYFRSVYFSLRHTSRSSVLRLDITVFNLDTKGFRSPSPTANKPFLVLPRKTILPIQNIVVTGCDVLKDVTIFTEGKRDRLYDLLSVYTDDS